MQAIQMEDFEKAAQLRDKIREVEKTEKNENEKKEKEKRNEPLWNSTTLYIAPGSG